MRITSAAVVALLLIVPLRAVAQQLSLAELARQEEARRRATRTPAKVYTNADVQKLAGEKADVDAKAPAAEPPPAPSAAVTATPSAEKPPEDPKKDEKYWRDRMAAARAELDRSKVYLEALQSRINALSTDFVNRDDPAQRAVIEADRKRAVAELERLKSQIQLLVKSIADTEEEARRLGVPPGWLR